MTNFIKKTVRNLRKNSTKSESILWQAVRNRKLNGKKFLRQHPLQFVIDGKRRFFIADFYCHERKLVVELDGRIHEQQKDYDELRTHIINSLGVEVIRFTNAEIEHNLDGVLNKIRQAL
jgi:very-short-patch-repair endonuclease